MRNFENTRGVWLIVLLSVVLTLSIGSCILLYHFNQLQKQEIQVQRDTNSRLEASLLKWELEFKDSLSNRTESLREENLALLDSAKTTKLAYDKLLEDKTEEAENAESRIADLESSLDRAKKYPDILGAINKKSQKDLLVVVRHSINAMYKFKGKLSPDGINQTEAFEADLNEILKMQKGTTTSSSQKEPRPVVKSPNGKSS